MPLARQTMIHRSLSLGAAIGGFIFPFLFVALLIEPKPIRDYKTSLDSMRTACRLELKDICNRYFPPPILKIGNVIKWGTNGLSEPFKFFGWYASENGGSWSQGEAVGIRFRLEEPVVDQLILQLRYSVYHPSDKTITLSINGASPINLKVSGKPVLTVDIPLPKSRIGNQETVNVTFEIVNPNSPADYSKSIDGRNIAIFMRELQLIRQ